MSKLNPAYYLLVIVYVLSFQELFSQAALGEPDIVMKLVEQKDFSSPTDSRIAKIQSTIVYSFNRVRMVYVNSSISPSSRPATFLLEIMPKYTMDKDEFSLSKMVDSTETMTFSYTTGYHTSATLIVTDISKGSLKSYHTINGTSSANETFILNYKVLGLRKGVVMTDSLKKTISARAFEQVKPKLPSVQEKAFNAAIKNIGAAAEDAPYFLFPVKLPVASIVESKKDKAEVVSTPGLASLRLGLNKPFPVYEITERKIGRVTYEQFTQIGALTNKTSTKLAENCEVTDGEKEIFAALQGGKKLWCSPFKPLTVNKYEEEIPGVAVLLVAPAISKEDWEKCYLKLRTEYLSARGTYYPMLDRTKLEAIQKEKNLQKSEAFIDKATVQQFKSIGAGYLLEVQLKDFQETYESLMGGRYKFSVNCITRLIEVKTGEILAEVPNTFTKNWSQSSIKTITTQQDLEYDAIVASSNREATIRLLGLEYLAFNLREVLNRALPQKIEVVEIAEEKKENAEALIIAGNFNAEIKSDDYFICRKKVVDVDGEQLIRMEQIGVVFVKTALGDGIALAKVKKGEKDIFKAVKAGDKLFCIDKPEWFINGQYTRQLKVAGF